MDRLPSQSASWGESCTSRLKGDRQKPITDLAEYAGGGTGVVFRQAPAQRSWDLPRAPSHHFSTRSAHRGFQRLGLPTHSLSKNSLPEPLVCCGQRPTLLVLL